MAKKGNIPWNKGLKGIKTNHKGGTSWNKRVSCSKETKEKLRISMKGRTSPNKGKTFSNKHRENLSLSHKGKPNYKNRGERSNLWKGGITHLHKKIRMCLEYSQWRNAVFKRDDYICQRCKKHGGYLEAHHIIPFRNIIQEYKVKTFKSALCCPMLWDIDNGITYCPKCHAKEDKFRARSFKW